MKNLLELEIPLTAPSLNQFFGRQHWSKRNALKNKWNEAVWLVLAERKAQGLSVKPIEDYPVIIETQSFFKDGRKRDSSNWITANKLIEDALVHCGILADDTCDYVYANFVYAPKNKAKENKTILTVRKAFI